MQTRRELNLIWFGFRLMDFDSIMLRNTGLQLIGLVAWGCCRRTDPVVPIVGVPQSLLNVTGLYSEHHGMVEMTFYDPALGTLID